METRRATVAVLLVAAAARVAATEDRLTVLVDSARDDVGRSRALALRDAVRGGREQVAAVAGGAGPARERLDGVQERLEGALSESGQV